MIRLIATFLHDFFRCFIIVDVLRAYFGISTKNILLKTMHDTRFFVYFDQNDQFFADSALKTIELCYF